MSFTKAYVAPTIDWKLNADAKWDEVDSEVRLAFENGLATKEKITAGTELYKFTDWDLPEDVNSSVTAWWSPRQPFKGDIGLDARMQLAKEAGLHPSEFTRQVMAVRTNWNGLNNILLVKLTRDVFGFWGKAAWQPRFGHFPLGHMHKFDAVLTELLQRKDKDAKPPQRLGFAGKGGQFYIPNLRLHGHVSIKRRFVHVDKVVSGEETLD